MKSRGEHASRADLAERLATVMQVSRAIRSEVARTICESSETRLASRQLRGDSLRTTARTAAHRRKLEVRETQRIRGIADAIAGILSSRGYAAFVSGDPQDTASIQ
jgi:hypothetical protein